MNIVFASSKLEKIFNTEKSLQREYGQQARKIMRRMMVLRTASTLASVPILPPDRCHQLSGDYKGCFAVDLIHPFRLVFEPADKPVPKKSDGGINLEQIFSIRILSVEDYH
ncbi:MAG: type II toxin-antitoxin system RelE/ParE family toxin [Sediminispirochaetaceae bacterium]